jgi:transcriptional regulator with XRE-family HTH domain
VKTDKENQRYYKELGAFLRKLREKKGWSLEHTEEKGFHDWKYLQRIESGRNITLATLIKLGELYGMEPWELLKGIKK